MLIDSHCHLDFPDFAADFGDVLARAHSAGVGVIVTICTRLSKFDQVRAIAEAHPEIYCTAGVHPHNTAQEGLDDPAALLECARHGKVVGIGETGLDFFYKHSPTEMQERSFRAHIAATRETGLPLIVHTRDADEDTVRVLEEEQRRGAFPGLIHCFTGSRMLAERAAAMGFYISFSGILTFKNAADLRDIARALPLERLLVETDAPYLAPVPNRGKRNEPAFVIHTASFLAQLRGETAARIADVTSENFHRLFSRVPRRAA